MEEDVKNGPQVEQANRKDRLTSLVVFLTRLVACRWLFLVFQSDSKPWQQLELYNCECHPTTTLLLVCIDWWKKKIAPTTRSNQLARTLRSRAPVPPSCCRLEKRTDGNEREKAYRASALWLKRLSASGILHEGILT